MAELCLHGGDRVCSPATALLVLVFWFSGSRVSGASEPGLYKGAAVGLGVRSQLADVNVVSPVPWAD